MCVVLDLFDISIYFLSFFITSPITLLFLLPDTSTSRKSWINTLRTPAEDFDSLVENEPPTLSRQPDLPSTLAGLNGGVPCNETSRHNGRTWLRLSSPACPTPKSQKGARTHRFETLVHVLRTPSFCPSAAFLEILAFFCWRHHVRVELLTQISFSQACGLFFPASCFGLRELLGELLRDHAIL